MKMIIEDAKTGACKSYKIPFSKLEPEDVDSEDVRIRMENLITYIKEALCDAKPVKEKEG